MERMIMGWVCHWDRIGVGEGIHGIDAAFTSKKVHEEGMDNCKYSRTDN
jgi:hypothetical protein